MSRALCTMVCVFWMTGAIAADGVISVASHHTVKATADRFAQIIQKKGLTLFTRINHTANAAGAGLSLRASEVVLFGNPKVGTPLMQCAPSVAIDLPQKMLIWEDSAGKVWLSYNDPEYLKSRHAMAGCDPVIEKISGVLAKLTAAAAQSSDAD